MIESIMRDEHFKIESIKIDEDYKELLMQDFAIIDNILASLGAPSCFEILRYSLSSKFLREGE